MPHHKAIGARAKGERAPCRGTNLNGERILDIGGTGRLTRRLERRIDEQFRDPHDIIETRINRNTRGTRLAQCALFDPGVFELLDGGPAGRINCPHGAGAKPSDRPLSPSVRPDATRGIAHPGSALVPLMERLLHRVTRVVTVELSKFHLLPFHTNRCLAHVPGSLVPASPLPWPAQASGPSQRRESAAQGQISMARASPTLGAPVVLVGGWNIGSTR